MVFPLSLGPIREENVEYIKKKERKNEKRKQNQNQNREQYKKEAPQQKRLGIEQERSVQQTSVIRFKN